ncbi:MAG: glycerophosphodiester phosphodiesterase family protein [Clostridia bacterium]|nr:glycerophosphodiester phosphodiesterase family protein [Clostridia bacterium]
MKFDLREKAKENIIVVAHRGAAGGNIPCNTLASYEIALKQGADMLEVDLSLSLDGELFLFHPGMEVPHLGLPLPFALRLMPSSAVKKLRYINGDNTATQFGIAAFDEFLEEFKGRCFINIDKFWSAPEKIYRAVARHGMTDQVLVKSKYSEKVLGVLKEIAPDVPYMPIVTDTHPHHEKLLESGINYVGVECCFSSDSAEVARESFIEKMHKDNTLVWANSIVFSHKKQLAGGHSDDTALTKSEAEGWGWLADRGFDLIQTDWPGMLTDYLKKSGKYYR